MDFNTFAIRSGFGALTRNPTPTPLPGHPIQYFNFIVFVFSMELIVPLSLTDTVDGYGKCAIFFQRSFDFSQRVDSKVITYPFVILQFGFG